MIQDRQGINFSYIAGLIPQEDQLRFKRILFRRTRGNVATVLWDLEKPIESLDNKQVKKTLYVVIFRESEQIRVAVNRICEAFSSEMQCIFP